MDTLLVLLGAAGIPFVIGVPGADDIMLNYQSTSFHDALFLRRTLGLKRAPEFERWLQSIGLTDPNGELLRGSGRALVDGITSLAALPSPRAA
jgi:ethanolamine ammonia-lyase large subunit